MNREPYSLKVEPGTGNRWNWSVWAYGGGRSGEALTPALAWQAARDAEEELRRSDAVARE